VRGFTQDDAHIFCTPDQIEAQIRRVLAFSLRMLRAFGFEQVSAYLATRPEKAVGDAARWEQATRSLEQALKDEGVAYEVDEGGGAFYGPKIDLKIKDALGREWQLSTIQFDFNLPERFDLTFTGADGQEHRPYMVHRALLGSLERFFGILIEHYAGAFPLWLAPEQVRVLPVTEAQNDYAGRVVADLKRAGVRVAVDERPERVGNKIRQAQADKVPYMLILGGREAEAGTVSVRSRSGEQSVLDLAAFAARLEQEQTQAQGGQPSARS
jgi:threonyl-tRNA synthetase